MSDDDKKSKDNYDEQLTRREWVVEYFNDLDEKWVTSHICKRESGKEHVASMLWCIEQIQKATHHTNFVLLNYRIRHFKNKRETISAVILVDEKK